MGKKKIKKFMIEKYSKSLVRAIRKVLVMKCS